MFFCSDKQFWFWLAKFFFCSKYKLTNKRCAHTNNPLLYFGFNWQNHASLSFIFFDKLLCKSTLTKLRHRNSFTLFENESITDINYPELLTAFYHYTGGPHISWFLVPKGYHEIRGSRILKLFLVLNPKLGPKIF